MTVSQGFYELLGVGALASPDEIRTAYQNQLAELVRRMRSARRAGADVTVLEAQERTLREAMQVLADPTRRRRYDAYRRAMQQGLDASDPDALVEKTRASLVDPATAAAVQLLGQITTLPVGAPFGEQSPNQHRLLGPGLAESVLPEFTDPRAPNIPIPGLNEPAPTSDQTAVVQDMPDASLESEFVEAGWSMPSSAPAGPMDDLELLQSRFGYDGRFLAGVRDRKGLTIDGVSEKTRISTRYLNAIEANDYNGLPAATFVRGYLREIARLLDLPDVDAVVSGYMTLFQNHRG